MVKKIQAKTFKLEFLKSYNSKEIWKIAIPTVNSFWENEQKKL